MKKLLLLAVMPLFLSAQMVSVSLQQTEPAVWPHAIVYDKLEITKDHYKQSYSAVKPEFLVEKIKVETKMYPVEGPTGHGLITTVYFLVEQDEFYIQSDCEMGHADGFLGPFKGNPKVILAKN